MTEEFRMIDEPATPRNIKEWVAAICLIGAPITGALLVGLLLEHQQKQQDGRGR
jgi:hypothetical protein